MISVESNTSVMEEKPVVASPETAASSPEVDDQSSESGKAEEPPVSEKPEEKTEEQSEEKVEAEKPEENTEDTADATAAAKPSENLLAGGEDLLAGAEEEEAEEEEEEPEPMEGEPDDLFKQGLELMEAKEYAKAVPFLSSALVRKVQALEGTEICPEMALFHYKYALALIETDRSQETMMQDDSDDIEVAWSCMESARLCYEKMEDETVKNKGLYNVHMNLGDLLSEQEQMKEAVEEYSKALEIARKMHTDKLTDLIPSLYQVIAAMNNAEMGKDSKKYIDECSELVDKLLASEDLTDEVRELNLEIKQGLEVHIEASGLDEENAKAKELMKEMAPPKTSTSFEKPDPSVGSEVRNLGVIRRAEPAEEGGPEPKRRRIDLSKQ